MAEVKIVPRISCDNCGFTEEKVAVEHYTPKIETVYRKPKDWGECHIQGSRAADIYGLRERLDYSDLCPECAHKLFVCSAGLLADIREEKNGE